MNTETYTTTGAWEWPATGTTWRVHHSGLVGQDASAVVAAAVAIDEQRWSRFLPGSDVSRVNAGAGRYVDVAPETLDLLEESIEWTWRTHGVFQPLVGRRLAEWGYDRSLAESRPLAASSPPGGAVSGAIEVDRRTGRARIPAGLSLDLGGIAKGWMADRAARVVRDSCDDPSLLVDAGGDLAAVRGDHLVDVETPLHAGASPISRIRLCEGEAVATSGFGRRSWRNGDGRMAHHLIDPATGEPGQAAHATVIAETAVAADVLATTLALRPRLIDEMHEAAMVIVGGDVRTTSRWNEEAEL